MNKPLSLGASVQGDAKELYESGLLCWGGFPRAKLLLGENLLHGNDLLMKALSARRSLIEE